MHHRKTGRKFGRTSSHRKAMFQNMVVSLIKLELIKTTLAKAKEVRGYIEPLITLAATDTVANRRLAFARLRDDKAVGILFTLLGPKYAKRPGGYMRVLKCGFRSGDKAPMAYIELVDRDIQEEATDFSTVSAPAAEKVIDAKSEQAEAKPVAKNPATKAESKPEAKANTSDAKKTDGK